MLVLYFVAFICEINLVVEAIGLDLQLGFNPRSMRQANEKCEMRRDVSDETCSEAQEDKHSSISGSREEDISLEVESDEEDDLRPVTVGIIVSNVAHLLNEALILRVTLNEFHRWLLKLEPCDDEKSDVMQDHDRKESMNGAEPCHVQGPHDFPCVCPCCVYCFTAVR